MPQPGQRRRVVEHLDDQPALQDQAQPDLALGVPDGVDDQLRGE